MHVDPSLPDSSPLSQVPAPYAQESQHKHKPVFPTPENSLILSPAPSLDKFLLECDERYGRKPAEYSQFLEKLEDEAISVQHFKTLTSEEFASLGITKIGWIMNLRQASLQYE